MYFIEKFKHTYHSIIKNGKYFNTLHEKSFENDRIIGEVLRNTHSIEKGLSIENVRLGFGFEKINEAYKLIQRYQQNKGDMNVEPIWMFQDALQAYLQYHETKNFSNERTERIAYIFDQISKKTQKHEPHYGGYLEMKPAMYNANERRIIEQIFNDRHSVREFAHTAVNEQDLHDAIELAFRCPSACNRQCYRVHIIPKERFYLLEGWFDGVGGFADDLEKLIIITGKISMYRPTEEMQHVVSAVVYASFLTMTLQIYGIGNCFLQRNIFPNSQWAAVAERLNISSDEQAVCALGIGNYKDTYNVPISHRLKYNTIVTEH